MSKKVNKFGGRALRLGHDQHCGLANPEDSQAMSVGILAREAVLQNRAVRGINSHLVGGPSAGADVKGEAKSTAARLGFELSSSDRAWLRFEGDQLSFAIGDLCLGSELLAGIGMGGGRDHCSQGNTTD